MKKLNLIEIAQVSGAASLTIYQDNSVEIKHLEDGEIFTFNDLQFTNRGYFDLEGKHLEAVSLHYTNIHNGFKIEAKGSAEYKKYNLTPV